ncbi:unnamed protein product [Pelagomonas calceolata]|uniref:PUB domain-containing protein n=1 Tax=Pelagomonas calceolata TaxID=35677 RepID=A0A8J2SI03_9STRA|nr:unnamed protein product [Pelagomonas calceolata]|mmetsp:Transcript_20355/g.57732  ORF Transcript_20355/g.57732 Transcript_20355/m.57732 type:complete len:213 (-) Transcript_20355:154-792(-)
MSVLILGGNGAPASMDAASTVNSSVVASVAAQVPKTSAAAPLLVKIVQNLERDPTNEKFRSINLEGKAGAKLVSEPAAMTLLATVGFETQGSRLVASGAPPAGAAAAVARALAPPPLRSSPQLNADGTPKVVVKESNDGPLTLKQQARRDAEQKAAREKEESKRQRLETLEKIKKDNHARKHDENWTTTEGVQKGGKDINTFRGKYGEDKGG